MNQATPDRADGSARTPERVALQLRMLEMVSRSPSSAAAMRAFAQGYLVLHRIDVMVRAVVHGLDGGAYRVARYADIPALVAGRQRIDGANSTSLSEVLRGGFIGSTIEGGVPRRFDDLRLGGDPVLGDLAPRLRSAVALPIFLDGAVHHWSFYFRPEPGAFDDQSLEDALLTGNLIVGAASRLSLLDEVRSLNAALEREFEDVAAVQRSLLPQPIPRIPGLGIAARYLTSRRAGGDYYDVLPLPDGTALAIVADVSGHGAGAATVVAMLHAVLHGRESWRDPATAPGPAEALAVLNEELSRRPIGGNFITAFAARWNPSERRLDHATAGHPAPLRRGLDGRVRALDAAGGLPLAIERETSYEEASTALAPGELVVAYTDGISEARDDAGRLFGVDRLALVLGAAPPHPEAALDAILGAVSEFSSRAARADDQTLLALAPLR
ncbi:MAG TPA: PP2C family protein-serine/threonine phosphatase [Phycisphaerales bacterium]|nr:PP2C family protein-serine/threonine phosphatase [Phycisphaerales bacterium]HMP37736.1 PP2C family protein-serine/threonine phosphatase [Phycisphaerales bacterium]